MPEKELRLPRMGETMDEGTIAAWLKQPGEKFRRGETLVEVESDKTYVEIPALEDGEIVRHLVSPGETVAVDRPIAVILTPNTAASQPSRQPLIQETISTEHKTTAPLRSSEAAAVPKTRASPAARRTAKKLGIDITEISGTGPRGRVSGSDVIQQAGVLPNLSRHSPAPAGAAEPASHAESNRRVFRWGTRQLGVCVLLHGFAGDPSTWRRTGEFLADQGFEVVAVELPGHGNQPFRASDLNEMAADLITTLPNPANGKFHLVGHSLGGALGIIIAASVPDRIASLTLLAPFGIGTYINQSFLDGIVAAETIDALERELRKTTARPLSYSKSALAAMLEVKRTDTLQALHRIMARDGVQQLFLVPKLEKMNMPVRIFFGRQDQILRWQECLSLPGKIGLHLFDTGHMPHWEDPSAVLPTLSRFPAGGPFQGF
jgi:pimeloyl-ACP methyl ester carboxylesterase